MNLSGMKADDLSALLDVVIALSLAHEFELTGNCRKFSDSGVEM
jgi:hypothetical protein